MADGSDPMVLVFKAGNRLFCMKLGCVERVIQFLRLQSVPSMPPYFKGLLDMQGISLPVIDIAEFLEKGDTMEYSLDTPIILCESGGQRMGLIVEQVVGVEIIRQADFDELQDQDIREYILGTLHVSGGTCLYLNSDKLLKLNVSALRT